MSHMHVVFVLMRPKYLHYPMKPPTSRLFHHLGFCAHIYIAIQSLACQNLLISI